MSRQDDLDPATFKFRGLHPDICLGTASDRYAGWIGQIYSEEIYASRISSRTKKVGKHSFRENVLPVESLDEYFRHFRVLEIDYTFYRPLLDSDGNPTQSYHVLKSYRDHMADEDRLILKVPQVIFARKIPRAGRHQENPDYLNPEMFTGSFYKPAVELLGQRLKGFVFEQEYQPKQDRQPLGKLVEALSAFLEAIPRDDRYHMELRTESYLSGPVFEVLEKYGIGQVLSHWTWLPPLRKQFARAGLRFLSSGKQSIIRLMTPLGVRYEDAYALAYPFDKLVDDMLQPKMIDETAELMWEGVHDGVRVNVIINNRSGGNAPLIARQIATRFLAESSSSL